MSTGRQTPDLKHHPYAWLQSSQPEVARGGQEKVDDVEKKIWFKSQPLTREFCHRLTHLQLTTDSHDQGFANYRSAGSWSWFEVAILPSPDATEPRKAMDGKELVFHSHSNRLGIITATRSHGVVFDRRSKLLANLEVGDVLAVRICARFNKWENIADYGFVEARFVQEDLFVPQNWTLTSVVRPKFDKNLEDGVYTFTPTTSCYVHSDSAEIGSKMWFTSPAFDKKSIAGLEAVQLFSYSRHQGGHDAPDSWSWFDIAILENAEATTPKVKNGVTLVWLSHANRGNHPEVVKCNGQLFDQDDPEEEEAAQDDTIATDGSDRSRTKEIHQIRGALEVGNVIAVRVCAQFAGWENYAEFAQLVVRISNEEKDPDPTVLPDLTEAYEEGIKMQKDIDRYYQLVSSNSQTRYHSETTPLAAGEQRADMVLNPPADAPPPYSGPPLRVLSLDGGGVRGVSSLRILRNIMKRIATTEGLSEADGDKLRPCDYFDMMAGTSTGGLIALMLGQLEYTVKECEDAYDRITMKIFYKKQTWVTNEKAAFALGKILYDYRPLVEEVKSMVKLKFGNEDMKMKDAMAHPSKTSQCKVLVMSALASNTADGNTAVQLRNYNFDAPNKEHENWCIWEAARATSAAPVFFERLRRNGFEYVDGGLGWNNPIIAMGAELNRLYTKEYPKACVLSLGTGVPPSMKLSTGLASVEGFIQIATNSESAHHVMSSFYDPNYYRFNLSLHDSDGDSVLGLVPGRIYGTREEMVKYEQVMVAMDDYKNIPAIREMTDKYLGRIGERLDACAEKMYVASKK